ncbi:Putative universal stress protein [Ralstonia mannitolilytica]|uniref:universal stress protein n=1 Tax=Ralstonia mannitolilytica TaxID=105219 RepID=UPI0007AFE696|nr:universal stress protein [Ralstonia mannitolilytica]ANA35830.1 universal stress protein UspA [Ralstonia mannitolilytica]CAJ0686574.1 Putative universal stress protein [Ralstonia mannitolilytica]CAJ0705346.1 Putative universal stress protein [Ralstonia mannitolilytica]CAJ0715651.1 Putative universal stress protein [Ralstonia mannitolilytica]CAJ0874349.1 Putative universal stress protein [Ralstonia mannitolilytica]
MYDKILVAVDGSPTSDRALDEAIRLAQKLGSELVIAHVIDNAYLKYDVGYIDTRGFMEALIAQGKKIVGEGRAKAAKAGVHVQSIVVDDPIGTFDVGFAIEQTAQDTGAQAVVLGTHGRRGFQRLLLGSVAESVVRQSTLPVLLVRAVPTDTPHLTTEPLSNVVIA